MSRALKPALAVALWASLAASGARGAPPPAAGSAPFRVAIEKMADDLQADYVFPKIGAQYAAMLRANLTKGRYDGVADPVLLAKSVTEDLKAVSEDRHLRVRPEIAPPPPAGPAPGGGAPMPPAQSGPPHLVPIEEAKWLDDRVAYIRFSLFPGDPETVAAVDRFMREHATARALIIDARGHHGGGIDEMNVMLPYLYAKRAVLLDMEISADVAKREGFPIPESAAFQKVAAPAGMLRYEHSVIPNPTEHRLFNAKVYYLTSGRTGSAAEHLALAFKRTHRATLVGERTGGADHFGGFYPVGQGLEMFVPMGRSFDPVTGADWEGAGIAPDVAVPSDQALETALKLAEADRRDAGKSGASKRSP